MRPETIVITAGTHWSTPGSLRSSAPGERLRCSLTFVSKLTPSLRSSLADCWPNQTERTNDNNAHQAVEYEGSAEIVA